MQTDNQATGIPPFRIAIYCILAALGALMLFKPQMFRNLINPPQTAAPLDPSLKNVVLEKEIPNNKLPVLLMFSSQTCGVCATIRPSVLRVAKDYSGKVSVVEASVDEDYGYSLADSYKISGVPTFILLNSKRKAVGGFSGGVPEDYLRKQVEALSRLKN